MTFLVMGVEERLPCGLMNSASIWRSNLRLNNAQINLMTPKDPYSGRTAPLASKRCILYNYSTNIGTKYFKRGIYSAFFLFKMQFVS